MSKLSNWEVQDKVCDIKYCLNLYRFKSNKFKYRLCSNHYFNIIESIKSEWNEYINKDLIKYD